MALAGSQCLAGRRTTACFMLFNKTCSGSLQAYAAGFRSLRAVCYPALSVCRDGGTGNDRKLTITDRDNDNNNTNDGEVSSRGVSWIAAIRRPACYPTTTTIAKLLRSSRLKVASRLAPGDKQRCLAGPGGGGGGGHGVFLVRAYSGGNNNNTGTTGAPLPLYRTKTGYYDVLGVSPGAKPAQIKTAYYRQSFLHHPDKKRVAGDEEEVADATRRFSDISEAYSVLGNAELKTKYDRGLLNSSDLVSSSRPSPGGGSSTTSGEPATGARSPSPVSSNQYDDLRRSRSVFNFDDFIKSHYGGQLRDRKRLKWEKEDSDEMETDASVMAFIALLSMIALALLLSF